MCVLIVSGVSMPVHLDYLIYLASCNLKCSGDLGDGRKQRQVGRKHDKSTYDREQDKTGGGDAYQRSAAKHKHNVKLE